MERAFPHVTNKAKCGHCLTSEYLRTREIPPYVWVHPDEER
jgi:hypothetical protein